jgi:hypothetical protein
MAQSHGESQYSGRKDVVVRYSEGSPSKRMIVEVLAGENDGF